MLKLRSGREERKKNSFQCLLLGTLGTQVGACALGRGRLALKESSRGAGGYRAGDIQRLCTKEGMPPAQPPIGLNWLMGVGCLEGEWPHLECSHLTLC